MEEKAFQVSGESSFKGKAEYSGGRGFGRGGFRGRGRGGGRGRGYSGGRGQFGGHRQSKSNIQCHYCKKFGHKELECWSKLRGESKANFTENPQEESNLFMAHSNFDPVKNVVCNMVYR